jgi:GNAT superfamily N-acetyltransferase
VKVRDYRRGDTKDLLRLVRALAEYESLPGPGPAEARRLAADAGRRFQALIAVDEGGRAVGYAIWFLTYSTFLARPTLWLEDLFVDPACRGTGAGTALFDACVAKALAMGCGRMEWTALDWNTPAHRFYERKGARRLKDWWIFRLIPSGRPKGRPSRRGRGPSRTRRA